MTDQELQTVLDAQVTMARRINRNAAEQYAERGLQPCQIAEAAVLSAFDIAEALHKGNGVAAIEWMRSALDLLEKGVWDGKRA